ncbi:MAG: hypothetical protein Q9167_007737 [Letrouitia subvulpina]
MAKSKSAKPSKADKGTAVKAISSVKEGAVTKPLQTAKAKSKELAKGVAAKAEKAKKDSKKSKKPKKEPTPEPSSESESDSVSDSASDSDVEDNQEISSDSFASIDEEAEVDLAKPGTKSNGTTVNRLTKAAPVADAESSESSESSKSSEYESSEPSDSDAEAPTPKAALNRNLAAMEEGKSGSESDNSENEDSEDESAEDGRDSDEESDEDVKGKNGSKSESDEKAAINEEIDSVEASDDDSEEESEDPNKVSGEVSDEGSDESSEDEKEAVPAKKRKASPGVAPAAAKKSKTEADAGEVNGINKAKLFVGNLSWNVDDEWLAREFENIGEIKAARVIFDQNSGRSRGFGYVEFADPADGIKAHKDMKDAIIDGRTINLDFSEAKKNDSRGGFQDRPNKYGDVRSDPSNTLFLANLPFGCNEDDVGKVFKDYNVTTIRLPTDRETGKPKGIGYVQFTSIKDASDAIDSMAGATINGRTVRLDFAGPKKSMTDSPRGGFGGFRGERGGDRGSRGGGRGGRGSDRGGRGGRGGRGNSTNRGGFGDFQGKKMTF